MTDILYSFSNEFSSMKTVSISDKPKMAFLIDAYMRQSILMNEKYITSLVETNEI